MLVIFYGLVYGSGIVFGGLHNRPVMVFLSSFVLGTIMLLAAFLFVQRDASWQESLGLGHQSTGSILGWSLLGFIGTYVVNVLLISMYATAHGDLEAVVERRAIWMGGLSQLPSGLILPLAAFAAIWEETVFRGFLLGRLRASIPVQDPQETSLRRDVMAIVLTAICFGLGHGYQGVLGIVQTTLAGMALGALTVWRNSLWPAIGAHLAIDAFGLVMIKMLKPMLDTVVSLAAVR